MDGTNVQKSWGWMVASDLFLAGTGGGAYFIAVLLDILQSEISLTATKIGITLSIVLVFIGLVFLISDLGSKNRAHNTYRRISSSWIARGTLIITCFLILAIVHFIGWVWPFDFLNTVYLRNILEIIVGFFALSLIIYTGFLLSDVRPILLWSTSILPILFLVSSLSTGAMIVAIPYIVITSSLFLDFLTLYILILVVIEAFLVLLWVSVANLTITKISITALIKGELSMIFWFGVVLLALVFPFLVSLLNLVHVATSFLLVVGFSLGIIGSFVLRYVIISAGRKAPLEAAGIVFNQSPK
jgi:formate-dependent nitrite reductase membrane component NrfD